MNSFIQKILEESLKDLDAVEKVDPESKTENEHETLGFFPLIKGQIYIATRISDEINSMFKQILGFKLKENVIRFDFSLNDADGELISEEKITEIKVKIKKNIQDEEVELFKKVFNYKTLVKTYSICFNELHDFINVNPENDGIIFLLQESTEFLPSTDIKRKDINYLTIIQNHIHLFPNYNYRYFNTLGEEGYVLYKT